MNFIHPVFLSALGALSLPLAIHFLRSRKLKTLDLGTLRFVREAMAETTRWQRLREWLLLALRVLMVALAALLFARPYLRQDTPPPGTEAGSEWIVVLDASASMRFVAPGTSPPGSTPPNAALNAFRDRLTDVPAGIKTVALALADSVEQVNDANAAGPLVGGPCDFSALARWLEARSSADPHTPRRVFFFTDLQQPASALPPDIAWPPAIPIEIVSVLPPSTRNLAAGSLSRRVQPMIDSPTGGRSDRSRAEPDEGSVTLDVPVLSVGDTTPQKFIADSGPGTVATALAAKEYPAGASTIEVRLQPETPGLMDAMVRLRAGDAWPMDDQRAYVVRFTGREPILLVDGDPGEGGEHEAAAWETPGGSPFASEVYFLRHALATPDRGQPLSIFDPVATTSLGTDLDTRPWKAIALCNVASLDDDTLNRLAARVQAGCGLLIFPGSRIDEAGWRRIHDAGLCPAEIALMPEPAVPRPLAEWDPRHPALAAFAAREQGDLSRFILKDRIRIVPDPDAEVLARMDGQRPALVAKPHGQGRIMLFANPADRDWTDFPSERMYLPFMHALVRHAAGLGASDNDGLPPDRTLELADRRLPGRHSDAVLHVAEEESTSPFLDEESFRNMLRLGAAPAPLVASGQETWRQVKGAPQPREWWPWLALALLVFIITETFLADHKRPARAAA